MQGQWSELLHDGTQHITELAREYAESIEWVRREGRLCNQPFASYCYLPPVTVKKLKNQLYPSVSVYPRNVIIAGLTWSLTYTWDEVMGKWRAYLQGEMGDEDREHLEELMSVEGSEWEGAWQAWQDELARRRQIGWMRAGLVGVDYRKADANKRMGPKGEVPRVKESKKGVKKDDCGEEPGACGVAVGVIDVPASGRCPRGYRRVACCCRAKEDQG